MKRLATLAAVLVLLSATSATAMQDAGQTGFYDRDETTGGKGGEGGWKGFMDGLAGLLDLGSGKKNAPKCGCKGNPKKGDFYGGKGDKGLGSRASPTRGGAYD